MLRSLSCSGQRVRFVGVPQARHGLSTGSSRGVSGPGASGMHTHDEAGCTLAAIRVRALLLPSVLAVLAGCAAILEPARDAAPDAGNPTMPECRAESYAFAGRGTLAGLGLVGQSKAELPEPNRPAMIWVTRDPVPFDAAEPGGSRMLCFEFDDGTGGSEWPISAAWQPPGAVADIPIAPNPTIPLLLVAVVSVLVVGGTVLAFRRR